MTDDSLERYKLEMERRKFELEASKNDYMGTMIAYQQVNMQGQAAMKAALLINGGASVAMLAFIGTAMNNGTDNSLLLKLCCSMLVFVGGVLSVAIAMGVTYLAGFIDTSQKIADQSGKKSFGLWPKLNVIAIALVVFGYVGFGLGSWNAYTAFINSLSQ